MAVNMPHVSQYQAAAGAQQRARYGYTNGTTYQAASPQSNQDPAEGYAYGEDYATEDDGYGTAEAAYTAARQPGIGARFLQKGTLWQAGAKVFGAIFENKAEEITTFKRFLFVGGAFMFWVLSAMFTSNMLPFFFPHWTTYQWVPVAMFTITEIWLLSTKHKLAKALCYIAFFFDWLFNAVALHDFAGISWQPGSIWSGMLTFMSVMLAIGPELLFRDGTKGITRVVGNVSFARRGMR